MKILWAPWRSEYIKQLSSKEAQTECVFCLVAQSSGEKDDELLVVHRSKNAFVIMNRFPYNTGHIMIVPYRHVSKIEELRPEELHELSELIVVSVKALKIEYNPEGFNIGMNIGRVAGAGIEGHVHVHIVPRWTGDSNFMPVVAETKVISESLKETYIRLKKAFSQVVATESLTL